MTFAFLWGSSDSKHRFHLSKWEHLSWPNEFGGWDIKQLHGFSIALRLKNLWSVLLNDGLWHRVILHKYLKKNSVEMWLRGKNFKTRGVSAIWKGFLLTLPWLGRNLTWQVGNGKNVLIGIDLIVGVSNSLMIPPGLREYFEDLDIVTLAQAQNLLPDAHSYWYSTEDLDVGGEWKVA